MLPRQRAIDEFAITEEDTEFRFAGDFTAWWIPAQFGPGSGDEHLWRRTALSAMEAAATPVTVDAGGAGYASVHEADLIDYAAMNVEPAGDGALRSALVALPDGVKVRGTAPHDSPWRTLVIGDTPAELVESTMILNLNDPCAICRRDTSWIEPGKYVGVWWEIHKGQSEWATGAALPHGATTENVKRYIDFAARHGIDHVLAEGWNVGWADRYTMQDFLTPTPDLDLEEVAAYARRKGVRWMAHNETGGNASNYMSQIEPAFSLYERLGVRAVKTGYAGDTTIDGVLHNHYDQAMVNHYRETIRIAARHHLMVEAHEMVKDTGERRTYPNIMTREAVRGIEWEAWSEGNPPEHLVNIPFTRMLSGPVSYTPGIFDTTWDPGRAREAAVADARDHAGALDPRRADGDLPRVSERPADDGRRPRALRGRARARVPRAGAHDVGRHEGDQRPDRRPRHRGQAERAGLVRRQPDGRAGPDAVDPVAVPGLAHVLRGQRLRRRADHGPRDQPGRGPDQPGHRQQPRPADRPDDRRKRPGRAPGARDAAAS